jgi:hypothetical protein
MSGNERIVIDGNVTQTVSRNGVTTTTSSSSLPVPQHSFSSSDDEEGVVIQHFGKPGSSSTSIGEVKLPNGINVTAAKVSGNAKIVIGGGKGFVQNVYYNK